VPGILGVVEESFRESGVDLAALGLAWARATPVVMLVPAFGLKALPAPARVVIALALAGTIYPALLPIVDTTPQVPWALAAVFEVLRGLPVAIAAAIPLWAATMAGGLVDTLRGAQDAAQVPIVEGRATPLGVPFAILASTLFLSTGGPSRIALALATRPIAAHPLAAAAQDLAGGIGLAVSIGGPLLAAALVLEIAGAVIARASSPAQVHGLLAPLRALALLGIVGVVLDRIAALMAIAVRATP
jgi:type III secretory pathway component EscT